VLLKCSGRLGSVELCKATRSYWAGPKLRMLAVRKSEILLGLAMRLLSPAAVVDALRLSTLPLWQVPKWILSRGELADLAVRVYGLIRMLAKLAAEESGKRWISTWNICRASSLLPRSVRIMPILSIASGLLALPG